MWLLRLKQRFPILGVIRRRLREYRSLFRHERRRMPVFTCTLFYSYFRMYAAIDDA